MDMLHFFFEKPKKEAIALNMIIASYNVIQKLGAIDGQGGEERNCVLEHVRNSRYLID
jgi:hypothetical protein